MTKGLASLAFASGLLLAPAIGNASTVDFVLNASNSEVTITSQADGFVCSLTSCGVEANIVPGFGGSFTLDHGEEQTFDFIEWIGVGTGAFLYAVEATLAFLEPSEATTTSGGGGFGIVLNGFIKAGGVFWEDVPRTVTLTDGHEIEIDFEDGITLLAGHKVISGASVALAPVPLPLPIAMLLGGCGVLALVARRRSIAAV